MSSSVHVAKSKKHILILGEGPIQVENTDCRKKYSIYFTDSRINILFKLALY